MDGLTLAIAAIGWGLVALGGASHARHFGRLRTLLAAHTDHDRPAAAALVGVETALAAMFAAGVVVSDELLLGAVIAIASLGVGFTVWVGRLLLAGSDLPCACSFSASPTSRWSLLRAVLVIAVLFGTLVERASLTGAERLSSLAVGLAVAASVHVLPEAMEWPASSRAHLARLDSHSIDRLARR